MRENVPECCGHRRPVESGGVIHRRKLAADPGGVFGQAWGVAIHLPDKCCAVIAMQSGVLSLSQALETGMSSDSVETLLRTGRWQRMYRGVYATFTGSPSREALLWAVVVRAGPGAALGHTNAA